jgi:hypothetical protein
MKSVPQGKVFAKGYLNGGSQINESSLVGENFGRPAFWGKVAGCPEGSGES